MTSNPSSYYRPDIDGLRAVAVTAVVLFHTGLGIVPGGYTGVDIFFVVSGYLITSIIQREINSDNFSLIRFWERRIRRIVPPLFVVILFTMIGAWLWLLPGELREYSQSLAAQAAFLSNMFFWTQSGYFATAAELKPLQHTWSLAIEEQFYLLFPWLLILTNNYLKKYCLYLLLALAAASFITSLNWVLSAPDMAFYWLPSRAWELLMGSMLVYMPALPAKSKAASPLSISGLLLLIATFIVYTPDTRFPGMTALMPCLGAALIIYAHKNTETTTVYKALSLRPMVAIGLISYSLYLWHWPLFAFARNTIVGELPTTTSLLLILVSVALATISLKLVENPIRSKRLLTSSHSLFKAAIVAFVFCICAGLTGHFAKGFPQRLEPTAKTMATGFLYINPRRWECLFTFRRQYDLANTCTVGLQKEPTSHENIDFLVVGDSHANSIMPLVDQLSKDAGLVGLQPVYNGCPPILNIYRSDASNKHHCHAFNVDVLKLVEARKIKHVMLVGRWSFYALDGVINSTDSEGNRPANWHQLPPLPPQESKPLVSNGLKSFIDALPADTQVSILKQIPKQIDPVTPNYLAKRIQLGDDLSNFGVSLHDHLTHQSFANNLIDQLASQSDRVTAIDPTPFMCNEKFCPAAREGGSMYRDFNHVSTYGLQFVAEAFNEFFSNVSRWQP